MYNSTRMKLNDLQMKALCGDDIQEFNKSLKRMCLKVYLHRMKYFMVHLWRNL